MAGNTWHFICYAFLITDMTARMAEWGGGGYMHEHLSISYLLIPRVWTVYPLATATADVPRLSCCSVERKKCWLCDRVPSPHRSATIPTGAGCDWAESGVITIGRLGSSVSASMHCCTMQCTNTPVELSYIISVDKFKDNEKHCLGG